MGHRNGCPSMKESIIVGCLLERKRIQEELLGIKSWIKARAIIKLYILLLIVESFNLLTASKKLTSLSSPPDFFCA